MALEEEQSEQNFKRTHHARVADTRTETEELSL